MSRLRSLTSSILVLLVIGCQSEDPPLVSNVLLMHHSSVEVWLSQPSTQDGPNDSLLAYLLTKPYLHKVNAISYIAGMDADEGRPASLGPQAGTHQWIHSWILWFNDYLDGLKTYSCREHLNRIIIFNTDFEANYIDPDGNLPVDPFDDELSLKNYKAVFQHPDGPGKVYTHKTNKATYRPLEQIFAANAETLFIFITPSPMHYAPDSPVTDAQAGRMRIFVNWLKTTWLESYQEASSLHNVAIFDWFDLLANPEDHAHPNRLKKEFGGESGDSLPNEAATKASTQAFAAGNDSFLDQAYTAFEPEPVGGGPGEPPPKDPKPAEWKQVKAGSFIMGAPADDPCSTIYPDQHETEHQVTLTHDFEITATEVTQAQFQQALGYNPSYNAKCGPDCPVENITWFEAVQYCNALSLQQGLQPCYECWSVIHGHPEELFCTTLPELTDSYQPGEQIKQQAKIYSCEGYRLPTEAEWEHAYRVGTTTAYYSGAGPTEEEGCEGIWPVLDAIGWYWQNSGYKTHPVGQKQPNGWGLYDMAGNVAEYTHDEFLDDLGSAAVTDPVGPEPGWGTVLRGGSVYSWAGDARASYRYGISNRNRCNHCGLRCVRTISP